MATLLEYWLSIKGLDRAKIERGMTGQLMDLYFERQPCHGQEGPQGAAQAYPEPREEHQEV